MSQFRTTADVLDEILTVAGEPTNGNSPYESTALTYANRVHHAFISGGNIFNLNADEPWVWARARQPITFELQSAVTSSFTGTAGSTAITFGSAPSASVEGWHVQQNGMRTVYKIMNHTAGSTSAQLDSGLIETAGGTCRTFKLDYDVMPSYFYVDGTNDRLNFQETAATVYTASLSHGTYTSATLLSHVFAQMSAAGTGTVAFSGALNSTTRFFSITASVTCVLMGASGADYRRSVLPTLGFDVLDRTASSFTAAYTPNAVSRLIEPFKIHSTQEQFVYSTDTIRMQQDFPLSFTREQVPTRFARLGSDREGAITVRFNSYPKQQMKVQADWIPRPLDLQDNAASFVLIPREDMGTFINAVAALIAFDKEDTKFQTLMQLASAGLDAMKAKNRALLNRTGEDFAQIIPREDLVTGRRKLNYGYTSGDGRG